MNMPLKPATFDAADYEGHRFVRELSEDTPEIWDPAGKLPNWHRPLKYRVLNAFYAALD